jgi:hypothetical protein
MKHIVQFDLADGSPVYVEVDEPESPAHQRVSVGGVEVEKAQDRFVDAIRHIKPAAEGVLQTFRELHMPDEIHLEFGIKLSGKIGAIIAAVDSEANFKVSLKWAKKT